MKYILVSALLLMSLYVCLFYTKSELEALTEQVISAFPMLKPIIYDIEPAEPSLWKDLYNYSLGAVGFTFIGVAAIGFWFAPVVMVTPAYYAWPVFNSFLTPVYATATYATLQAAVMGAAGSMMAGWAGVMKFFEWNSDHAKNKIISKKLTLFVDFFKPMSEYLETKRSLYTLGMFAIFGLLAMTWLLSRYFYSNRNSDKARIDPNMQHLARNGLFANQPIMPPRQAQHEELMNDLNARRN